MTKHFEIEDAERHLEELRGAYLRRWGWQYSCNIPGSYWLWRRDFADEDARRMAWWSEHPTTSKPTPYGVITAPTDLAVSITIRCLDEQPELAAEGEAPAVSQEA